MEPDKTRTLLVEHLREKPATLHRDELISAAEHLYYDDFGNILKSLKMQLYADLNAAGYADLAKNVVEGVYD